MNTFFSIGTEGVKRYVSKWSLWLFLAIFLTPVAITAQVSTFPWMEGFEGETFPPEGWDRFNVEEGGTAQWNRYSTPYAHNGSATAIHWYNKGCWLVTPQIAIPEDGNYQLRFWSSHVWVGEYDDSSVVYLSVTDSDPESFTPIFVLPTPDPPVGAVQTTTWIEITIPLTDYAGQNIYIAFGNTVDDSFPWMIDDVLLFDFTTFVDAEVISISTPNTDYDLSSAEPVKVTLRNNGGSELTGFQVKMELNGTEVATETFEGAIAPSDEVEYTFKAKLDLSTAGDYEITVTVIAENDQIPANDSKTKKVTNMVCVPISEFPYREGFEGAMFPPQCWISLDVNGNGKRWARNTTASYNHSGAGSASHQDFVGTGDNWLIMPQISIPATGNYLLKYWTFNFFTTSGTVLISDTDIDPASFTAAKNVNVSLTGWNEVTVQLSDDYAGKDIYIAFKYEGYYAYIDDILIYDYDTYSNAELASIVAPTSGEHINLTDNEHVKVSVKNNGTNVLSAFDLELKLTDVTDVLNYVDVATFVEHFTVSVPAGETGECTFATGLDLSADNKKYEITVSLNAVGNIGTTNLSRSATIGNIVCSGITALPWKETFETNTGNAAPRCWTSLGAAKWARTSGDTELIHNPPGAVMVLGATQQPTGSEGWLVTPQIFIPENGRYLLKFWSMCQYASTTADHDVMISTTGNAGMEEFSLLHRLEGSEIADDYQYVEITVSLEDYAGEAIYLAFRNSNNTEDSWYIDDVEVSLFADYVDGEVAAILAPATGELTVAEEVTVLIKNNGGGDLTGFDLTLELDGTTVATETFGEIIPSMSEAEYTFAATLDLSNSPKEYAITVTLVIAGDLDELPENNSLTETVISLKNIADATITLTPELYEYSGLATPESVAISLSGVALTADADYAWAITSVDGEGTSAGVNAGTVTITVTGENKYTGTISKTYVVAPKELTISGFDIVKFYDGDNNVTGFGKLVFDGLVNGETADVDESDVTATYANDAKGEHAITFTGDFGMTGGTATPDNYVVTQPTGIIGTIKPVVTGVRVTPNLPVNIAKGATQQFTAAVDGQGNPAQTVTWTVEGSSNSGTSVSESGLLTVGASEATGITLTIRATSTDDHTKSGIGTAIVIVPTSSGEIHQANPLKAWIRNDQLHVTGLTAGETLTVYNAAGALMYIAVVTSAETDINLSVSGAYIVRSGNHSIKVVY